MACGLFGKLQTKRDFVTVDLPRSFINVWEEWLQKSLADSQAALGDDWLPTFLSAPLWRFRIGEGISGAQTAGVIMPSMDGVGRKFPLTVACCAGDEEAFADVDAPHVEPWYDGIENFMLNLLDAEPNYEASLEALRALPRFPLAEPSASAAYTIGEAEWGHFTRCEVAEILPNALRDLRERERQRLLRNTSIWWTIGGSDWPAVAFVCNGLPSGAAFTAMLSGGFAGNDV